MGIAELGGDGTALRGDTLDGGGWDLDGLAVLDEELAELVLLKSGDDAGFRLALGCTKLSMHSVKQARGILRELLAGIDGLALSVEVGDTHAVRVVVATVGIAFSGEAVIRVGTATVVGLADVVVVVRARVGSKSERVRVGLPVLLVNISLPCIVGRFVL